MYKITPEEFEDFQKLTQKFLGIHLTKDKEYLLYQRIEPLVSQYQCKTFSEFKDKLIADLTGKIKEEFIGAITTGETSFFRDNHPFIAFQDHILPYFTEGIKQRKMQNLPQISPVRIWSCASSSGQEPYSIAMLIYEYAEKHKFFGVNANDFKIIATDICSKSLERCSNGQYNEFEIARGLSTQRRDKYFSHSGEFWTAKTFLKEMLEFHKLNLIEPFIHRGHYDIVFCRNVLIYFTNDHRQKIIDQIFHILNPGGVLILGSSENLQNETARFDEKLISDSLFYFKKEL